MAFELAAKRELRARVEGRIDVDQVELALKLGQEMGEDVEVITVVEAVAPGGGWNDLGV
jgi:hypothetical protein